MDEEALKNDTIIESNGSLQFLKPYIGPFSKTLKFVG